MPFEIVRNDIVNMQADAIVNTANPKPIIGFGVDAGIYKKAGRKLLSARKKIGNVEVGQAVITPGFDLDAKYIIHTVGPVWNGGSCDEAKKLRMCYDSSLQLALEHKCESVAFPLIASGNYGFPKSLALQIAISSFSEFLLKHDMQIYLVVFDKDAFELSEKLFSSVKSFIDENYVAENLLVQYNLRDNGNVKKTGILRDVTRIFCEEKTCYEQGSVPDFKDYAAEPYGLEEMLNDTDAGFSETLLKLIDKTGKKDSEIYKKANVDRKLFSKIRNNPDYRPSKATAIAFAVALELNLEETKDLIARAGFALSHSSKFDIIIEYFILNKNYDMFEINETLFAFDQTLLGV